MKLRNHRCYDSGCPFCTGRAEARSEDRDEPMGERECDGRENSYEAAMDRIGGTR